MHLSASGIHHCQWCHISVTNKLKNLRSSLETRIHMYLCLQLPNFQIRVVLNILRGPGILTVMDRLLHDYGVQSIVRPSQ